VTNGAVITKRGFYFQEKGKNNTDPIWSSSKALTFNYAVKLEPGKTYEYRAVVEVNGKRYQATSALEFKSPDLPEPTVNTKAATRITATGATLNGSVTTNGTIISKRGFYFQEKGKNNPNPIWATSGSLSFNTPVTLEPGKIYEFRAIVEANGKIYQAASTQEVTALPPVKTVSTNSPTNLKATSVTLNGSVTGAGELIKNRGFYFYEIGSGSQTPIWTGSTGTGSFKMSVTVEPGKTYEYRAVVEANGVRYPSNTVRTFTAKLK